MKNARNQHRTDYAKELVKIVQTTKDREELKKKIAAYHERDIANAIVESDKTVRKCIYDILEIAEIAESAMSEFSSIQNPSLNDIIETDREVRETICQRF